MRLNAPRRLMSAAALMTAVSLTPGTAAAAVTAAGHAPQAPVDLTVADRSRPLNVEGTPLFGWRPRDVDPGEARFVGYRDGYAVYEVGSGRLTFSSTA